jgi:hypothetical protein
MHSTAREAELPIVIIKKAQAPILPRADALVLEPHCEFVLIPNAVDVDIGPGLELYRCTECGATARNREKQGKPREQCDSWKRKQAKAEKAK